MGVIMTITTQAQVRAAFWRDLDTQEPVNTRKRQNDQPADVRMAFVDYVDMLARSGEISQTLAGRVTL